MEFKRLSEKISLRLLLTVVAVLACFNLPGLANDGVPASPAGPVILTVTGDIAGSNRPPFDRDNDLFFAFHGREFETAAEFDRAALEALGMHEVTVELDNTPIKVTGPRLMDVLDAVGVTGQPLTALALDGYQVEMTPEDVKNYDWIVGLKRNGRYLAMGQRAPIWIVPSHVAGNLTWPWGVFLIEVGSGD